jgi:hypothetical protein
LGLDHWQDQCPEVVDELQQAGIVTFKSQRLIDVRGSAPDKNLSDDKSSAVEWLIKLNYICFGISGEAFCAGLMLSYFSNIISMFIILRSLSPTVNMGTLRFREQSPLWVESST